MSNGTSPPQGQQLCQIILKCMHYCTSYGPDKSGQTHGRAHIHRTKIVTTMSRLPASGLDKNQTGMSCSLYLSRTVSKILCGCSKMILLCSGEDSIHSSTSIGSDIIMMSNCIYITIIRFFINVQILGQYL